MSDELGTSAIAQAIGVKSVGLRYKDGARCRSLSFASRSVSGQRALIASSAR